MTTGTPTRYLDAEAEADLIIEELAEEKAKAGRVVTEESLPEQEADEAPVVEDTTSEQDQVVEDAPLEDDGEKEVVAEEHAEEQENEQPEDDPMADLQAKYNKLEAAHSTLRGKTYAEVPRLVRENEGLRNRIVELENKESEKPEGSAPHGDNGHGKKTTEILAALKEDVSEDAADLIKQLVESVAAEHVNASIKPVVGNLDTLQRVSMQNAQKAYRKDLARLVPDWQEIAAKDEYLVFLQEPDAFTGKRLYDLAVEARDELDADRMSKFFNAYKKRNGISQTSNEPVPQERKTPTGKAALVSPKGKPKTTQRKGVGTEKPDYFTTKDLEKFNKDRRKMAPEVEAAKQARIDKAIQKGWIISS
jgi:hypothetical protein